MKIKLTSFIAAGALVIVGWSGQLLAGAHEQAPGCGDIEFVAEITDVFPEAANACLEIVTKNGEPYARFDAEIVRVRGPEVRAKFKKPSGEWTDTYAFRPDPDRRIKIQGRSYRYQDLGRGQPLDIFLATDKFELVIPDDDTDFATTTEIVTVVVYQPEPEPEMPKTASPLPLIALLGGVFLVFGGGLAAIRRRLVRR